MTLQESVNQLQGEVFCFSLFYILNTRRTSWGFLLVKDREVCDPHAASQSTARLPITRRQVCECVSSDEKQTR